jgi:hypothetical protein
MRLLLLLSLCVPAFQGREISLPDKQAQPAFSASFQDRDVSLPDWQSYSISPAPFQDEGMSFPDRQPQPIFAVSIQDRDVSLPDWQLYSISQASIQDEGITLPHRLSQPISPAPFKYESLSIQSPPFQDGDLPLTNYKSHPLPKDTPTLSKYKESTTDYLVYMKYGDVYATKGLMAANQPLPFLITATPADSGKLTGNRSIIRTNEGYLVAFYRAAAGGSLYLFDPSGKNKTKIAEQPLIKLLEGENVIYGINADTIHSIVKIDKKKGAIPFKKLKSTPLAADIDEEGNIIVITEKSLLSVDKNGTSHTLIEKGFWNGYLFPRSLVVYKGKIYIGMRNGILTYETATKKTDWLMEK